MQHCQMSRRGKRQINIENVVNMAVVASMRNRLKGMIVEREWSIKGLFKMGENNLRYKELYLNIYVKKRFIRSRCYTLRYRGWQHYPFTLV